MGYCEALEAAGLNYVKRNLEWDQDAKTIVQWLEERKDI